MGEGLKKKGASFRNRHDAYMKNTEENFSSAWDALKELVGSDEDKKKKKKKKPGNVNLDKEAVEKFKSGY